MSQCLPFSGFNWLNQKETDKLLLDSIKCSSIEENSSDRYILEADLKYHDELLQLDNDYQLAPEKLEISHNMPPDYCSSMAVGFDIKICGVNNLFPNLGDESKYVPHYRNLQLYLSLINLCRKHMVSKQTI